MSIYSIRRITEHTRLKEGEFDTYRVIMPSGFYEDVLMPNDIKDISSIQEKIVAIAQQQESEKPTLIYDDKT